MLHWEVEALRRVILVAFIIFSTLIMSCQAKKDTKPAEEIQVRQPAVEQNQPIQEVPKPQNSILDIVGEGRLPGIEFGIGASCKEIVNKMGKPKDQDFFEGGLYLDYDKVIFLTDSDESYNGKVTSISLNEGQIFGVNVGMKPSEIKKVLGKPSYEGKNEEEGAIYQLRYNVKGYTLLFASEKEDSPTLSASIVALN